VLTNMLMVKRLMEGVLLSMLKEVVPSKVGDLVA